MMIRMLYLIVLSSLVFACATPVPKGLDKQAWFNAIEKGELEYLKKELQRGVPATLQRSDGWGSLRLAVSQQNPEMVKLLLDKGASPSKQDKSPVPILHLAVMNNDLTSLQLLLKKARLKQKDSLGRSIFDLALLRQQLSMATYLALRDKSWQQGYSQWWKQTKLALPDSAKMSKEQLKALSEEQQQRLGHWAYFKAMQAMKNSPSEITMAYLQLAAQLRHQEARYQLARIYMGKSTWRNEEAAAKLSRRLRKDATFCKRKYLLQKTPFNQFLYAYSLKYSDNDEELKLAGTLMLASAKSKFLQAQYELADNYRRYFPKTERKERKEKQRYWLEQAANNGYAEAAEDLGKYYLEQKNIKQALDWHRKAGQLGKTSAYIRIAKEYSESYGELPEDHEKAIEWYELAAKAGDREAQDKLAGIYEKGWDGKYQQPFRAAQLYQQLGEMEKAQALIKQPLQQAILDNDLKKIDTIAKVVPFAAKVWGDAWLYANLLGNQKLVKKIMQMGMKIDYVHQGLTALAVSAAADQPQHTRWLIKQGADVNKITNITSPLMAAASRGRTENLKFLMQNQATVTASPHDKTPLMMAVTSGSKDSVVLLLKHGADVNQKNSVGINAYTLSKRLNNHAIQKILLTQAQPPLKEVDANQELARIQQELDTIEQRRQWYAGELYAHLDKTGKIIQGNPSFKDQPWSCVTDPMSGLEWTVKDNRKDSVHYYGHRLTHPSSKPEQCDRQACDIESYIKLVNQHGMCGKKDWRLPTEAELLSIAFQHAQKAFPYWEGFTLWVGKTQPKPGGTLVFSSGNNEAPLPYSIMHLSQLFGRSTWSISFSSTAPALLVRGKLKALPSKPSVRFTPIQFQ